MESPHRLFPNFSNHKVFPPVPVLFYPALRSNMPTQAQKNMQEICWNSFFFIRWGEKTLGYVLQFCQ